MTHAGHQQEVGCNSSSLIGSYLMPLELYPIIIVQMRGIINMINYLLFIACMEQLILVSNGSSVDLYSVVACSVTLILIMTLASTTIIYVAMSSRYMYCSILCDMRTLV